MRASIQRVLAIAPGAQHLGVAVLEGEELIWFGVKSFSGRKTAGTLLPKVERYIDELIARHTPGTLAIEEPYYAQARLSPLLGPLTAALKRSGRQQGLRVVRYLPTTVKARLCEKKRTRQGLAEAMIRRYWFLFQFAKPGRTRLYWWQMFDAVALGVLAARDVTKPLKAEQRTCRKGAGVRSGRRRMTTIVQSRA
jgi:Holliday junction resolvasome RuvABC endonuclease subunit